MCLISKNDTLGITGKWSSGTRYKMKDNIIIASCIENISSGLMFDITGT